MVRRPFSTSPSYLQSIRGLHRLHALALEGRDESPEADAVRDGLEQPWYLLSDIEKRRITGLSEDLYSLGEPQREVKPPNPQVQRKLIEAYKAQQEGDWDRALELLRRWGTYIEPALLAYLRGGIWREAGDYATAALFYRHAAESAPEDANYKALYLYCLDKSNSDTASAQAARILAEDESHPPVVVERAAHIRLKSTIDLQYSEAFSVWSELAQVLERAIRRCEGDEPGRSNETGRTKVRILILLGSLFDQLGRHEEAIRSYNQGLAVDPDNDALLVARGILRYGVDSHAADDFLRAIQNGSRLPWPYYFLAHSYLVNNRFEKCRSICEKSLALEMPDEVRASLLEWLAISRSEGGFPPDEVRSAFEAAMRLAPDRDQLRRNFAAFVEAENRRSRSHLAWNKPNDRVVQETGRAGFWPHAAAGFSLPDAA
jgi:tetratricopeptide (TPR) repeat protein